MKAGWEIKTLGEVYDVRDGTHDSPKYVESGYPLITSKNLKDKGLSFENVQYITEADYNKINARSAVHRGDVLFAMIGTIGNPTIVEVEPNFAIKNVALLKVPQVQNSSFLKYYLETEEVISKMVSEAKGTTQKFVGLGYLRNFPIKIPSLSEQQRIVAMLDQALEGIAKARANAEQNLQNARTLFESHLQSVFSVRTTPVHGELVSSSVRGELVEPRHPSTSSGRTVEGWEVKSFAEVLEIKNGKDQKPVEKAGGKYPIYGSAGNIMGWTDLYICDEQTTIIGRKGTINRPIFIETKFWNVDTAFGLAAKPNLNAKFLYFFCLSYDFSLHNRGTTIPSLVKTDLLNIKISVPSLTVQEQLVDNFSALYKQTQRLEALYQRKIACLDELKKSLLQQAFAGEL